MVCAQAAFEKDPFTLSDYTPVDLISSMTKIYEDALSGSGGLYAYVESQTGVKPTSYEHAYSLLKDKAHKENVDRYGENYKLKASVDQSNSSFYAGEEAQRKVLERTLSIEGVDMMSDIDSSTVREYRIYHVILEIEGTRRSKTAEYDVFLILVNNTWYVVRIYG